MRPNQQPSNTKPRRRDAVFSNSAILCLLLLSSGCSTFIVPQHESLSTSQIGPAKLGKQLWRQPQLEPSPEIDSLQSTDTLTTSESGQLRFEGNEVLLGTIDVAPLDIDRFEARLRDLLAEKRYYTASRFVAQHSDAAEQFLWENWSNNAANGLVRFSAKQLSQSIPKKASWDAMLEAALSRPDDAKRFQAERVRLTQTVRSNHQTPEATEMLRSAAQQLGQPVAMVEMLTLLGMSQPVSTSNGQWSQTLLRQAAELAERNGDRRRASSLWLMISINARQSNPNATMARTAWLNAIHRRVEHRSRSGSLPINTRFWLEAERHRPANAEWPAHTARALIATGQPIGCKFTPDSAPELLVWSAIGRAQQLAGEAQAALVSFKRAEAFAQGSDIQWLRIAQSGCLSALGQPGPAAALLAEPLSSVTPAIASAANAAVGSAKLQAGAFQQGARFLNKALTGHPGAQWPTRSETQADLALAMLIIGDTEKGLKAIHAAQAAFRQEDNLPALLQSMQNEVQLLQHEGRQQAADKVRARMATIERNG